MQILMMEIGVGCAQPELQLMRLRFFVLVLVLRSSVVFIERLQSVGL